MRDHAVIIGLVVVGALLGSACSESSNYEYVAPATVEELSEDLWQIELTPLGALRVGIETVEVVLHDVDGVERLCIPYSAVIYHFDGSTWTYANSSPLTYVRKPIDIAFIDGDFAILDAGPNNGTVVVSVGAAELYGVEFGIGK